MRAIRKWWFRSVLNLCHIHRKPLDFNAALLPFCPWCAHERVKKECPSISAPFLCFNCDDRGCTLCDDNVRGE